MEIFNWRGFQSFGTSLARQEHPNPKSGASANSATLALKMIIQRQGRSSKRTKPGKTEAGTFRKNPDKPRRDSAQEGRRRFARHGAVAVHSVTGTTGYCTAFSP